MRATLTTDRRVTTERGLWSSFLYLRWPTNKLTTSDDSCRRRPIDTTHNLMWIAPEKEREREGRCDTEYIFLFDSLFLSVGERWIVVVPKRSTYISTY